MLLCIDSGNTRLKWGVHDGQVWRAHGALAQTELMRLPAALPRDLPLDGAMVANVAGDTVADVLRVMLPLPQSAVQFAQSTPQAAGVSNGYRLPAQLGVDRWCALIGARGLTSNACIVVGAGTATTIDTLSADGEFLGGFILPGFELMRASLPGNTAQLPLAEGSWRAMPQRTQDAIVAGCIEAQVGAVERAFARIADQPGAQCLLFGGALPRIQPYLKCAHRVVEHLVLEGLLCLATSQSSTS